MSGGDGGGPVVTADPANILRAMTEAAKGNQEAYILREEAEQMKLDTLKKRAETDNYIKSITPTWGERQAKIARDLLANAQNTTNPIEISSGRALNVLLNDLRKYIGKKSFSSTPLGEDVLRRINVTAMENHGNLGLLRNDGNFTWPHALTQKGITSAEDREEIESRARALLQQAALGYVPRNDLAELEGLLNAISTKLARKANEIPGAQYLDAKRFLHGFNAARIALETGEGPAYFKYQKWISGGKTIQDVVDYMVQDGLQFASAIPGDESAYRAVHSALAAYDMEVNQFVPLTLTTRNDK